MRLLCNALLHVRGRGNEKKRPKQRERRRFMPGHNHCGDLIAQLFLREARSGLRVPRRDEHIKQITWRVARGQFETLGDDGIDQLDPVDRNFVLARSRKVGIAGGKIRSKGVGRPSRGRYRQIKARNAVPCRRISIENIERAATSSARSCMAASKSRGRPTKPANRVTVSIATLVACRAITEATRVASAGAMIWRCFCHSVPSLSSSPSPTIG
jgi:hypothetical protein